MRKAPKEAPHCLDGGPGGSAGPGSGSGVLGGGCGS